MTNYNSDLLFIRNQLIDRITKWTTQQNADSTRRVEKNLLNKVRNPSISLWIAQFRNIMKTIYICYLRLYNRCLRLWNTNTVCVINESIIKLKNPNCMLLNLLFSIYRKPIKCEWCIKTINIDLVGFMLQNEKKLNILTSKWKLTIKRRSYHVRNAHS